MRSTLANTGIMHGTTHSLIVAMMVVIDGTSLTVTEVRVTPILMMHFLGLLVIVVK